MVLTDGGQFLFFSEDLDGFSGKRTNISYLLHVDLQFFRDNSGGKVGFLSNNVFLELVPDGLSPEDSVIELFLGFSLRPFLSRLK